MICSERYKDIRMSVDVEPITLVRIIADSYMSSTRVQLAFGNFEATMISLEEAFREAGRIQSTLSVHWEYYTDTDRVFNNRINFERSLIIRSIQGICQRLLDASFNELDLVKVLLESTVEIKTKTEDFLGTLSSREGGR